MPVPVTSVSWVGSLVWLVALAVVAFGVSEVTAGMLHMRRTPYIAVLTLVTAAMTVGYVWWLGVGVMDMLTTRWVWGIVAAPVFGLILSIGITRLPGGQRLTGRDFSRAVAWEGVVYGAAEGVLLSMLPTFMTWQIVHSLGWSGTAGAFARWTLPIAASVAVIVVHHLGYWEYRNRLLIPIAIGCGSMSLGFLLTASWITPVLAHIMSHVASLVHGSELPPHAHTAEAQAAMRAELAAFR